MNTNGMITMSMRELDRYPHFFNFGRPLPKSQQALLREAVDEEWVQACLLENWMIGNIED